MRVDFWLILSDPQNFRRCETSRAGLATRSINASRPPAFSSMSRHWSAVRWSFHKSAGRNAVAPSPRKTEPCICPERPIAPMSAALRPDFFRTARVALMVACHQSSGFCSDHPGFGEEIGCSAIAVARTFPLSSQMSVLVPLVPMSIPSRWGMGDWSFRDHILRRIGGDASGMQGREETRPPEGASR